ncbi:MAG: hypothetical protein ACYC4H_11630 [Desulfocucumaceae bacterium]
MSQLGAENIDQSIERLIKRMESVYEKQASETERTENMLSLLDRLAGVLSRMEDGRGYEAEMVKKIETLNRSLEQTINIQGKLLVREGENTDNTFDKVISGVKIFGLVLSALANSIQLTVENISSVLNKNSDAAAAGPDKSRALKTQADLSSILLPVSTLVKNLVEEKMKQQEQGYGKEKDEVPGQEAGSAE